MIRRTARADRGDRVCLEPIRGQSIDSLNHRAVGGAPGDDADLGVDITMLMALGALSAAPIILCIRFRVISTCVVVSYADAQLCARGRGHVLATLRPRNRHR